MSTQTSLDQIKVQKKVEEILQNPAIVSFLNEEHICFLSKCAKGLNGTSTSIDSIKPWFVFWLVNSLSILDSFDTLDDAFSEKMICFFKYVQNKKTGGYGGGYLQDSHNATTFASICSLLSLGTEDAYNSIDRNLLYKYFMSMKNRNGSFSVCEGGETDVRGTYTVISIASVLNILTTDLIKGVTDWIAKCQTYEGGIAAEPGCEAHGGYSFCGFATLMILGKPFAIDFEKFVKWSVKRQMGIEGGFQGRTNKLVDSCYSFWIGALFQMFQQVNRDFVLYSDNPPLFDTQKLRKYLINCCQSKGGGMFDKPGVPVDLYHTMNAFSGLSICHEFMRFDTKVKMIQFTNDGFTGKRLNCLYKITEEKLTKAKEYFARFTSA